jgi:hypothetical protein
MTIHNMVFFYLLFLVVMCFEHRDCTFLASPLTFKSDSKLFSAIFCGGSPILPVAASDCNPPTDASNAGIIICKYYYEELLTNMRLQ